MIPQDTQQNGKNTKPRFLLADDCALTREIIAHMLRSKGYHIECIDNGADAVMMHSATPYDLIFMDISMPEMNGIMATHSIKKLKWPAAKVPIVALSAYVMTQDKTQTWTAYFTECLAKPINQETVFSCIDKILFASNSGQQPKHNHPDIQSYDILNLQHFQNNLSGMTQDIRRQIITNLCFEIKNCIRNLTQSALQEKPDMIERQTHYLKGLAATFGAEKLSFHAAQINHAICNKQHQTAYKSIEKIHIVADQTIATLISLQAHTPTHINHFTAST